jgi:molybdopterin/thiamine biosynthesis adenylyltransferase
MRYTITFVQAQYEALVKHLFQAEGAEQAAYLLCRPSITETEVSLLVREVINVPAAEIHHSSPDHMSIAARSFTSAMKKASDRRECFAFVHSHPGGYAQFSQQDDEEEAKLFRTAYVRIATSGVHASLVFTPTGIGSVRVWLPNGQTTPVERVRVVGQRFRYWFSDQLEERVPDFYDRQVRAFGQDIQRLLKRLRIGIVGVGGTGSCVAEQLVRLGVGSCVIADGGMFERSNVNRVYGSRVVDDGLPKVKITERVAADIGVGTEIRYFDRPISFQSVLREFRQCDAIFGCTDDEWGRSLLTRLAIYYCVPVFDMGVRIDSKDGHIRSIQGRVTTLLPGSACLYCRGRISAARVSAEAKRAVNPAEAAELAREGYIPELDETAPAVVPFTTTIAASAVAEFLHRLTGFKGSDRVSSEVLHLIDATTVRTNNPPSKDDCFCGDVSYWGRGDVTPFLDLTWRPEQHH